MFNRNIERCSICSRPYPDNELVECLKCGRLVCEDCYDWEQDDCFDCLEEQEEIKEWRAV